MYITSRTKNGGYRITESVDKINSLLSNLGRSVTVPVCTPKPLCTNGITGKRLYLEWVAYNNDNLAEN